MNKVKVCLELLRQAELEYSFELNNEFDDEWVTVQYTKEGGLGGNYSDNIHIEDYLMYNTLPEMIRNINIV